VDAIFLPTRPHSFEIGAHRNDAGRYVLEMFFTVQSILGWTSPISLPVTERQGNCLLVLANEYTAAWR